MMKLSRISGLCKINYYFNKRLFRPASDKVEIKNLVHLNQRTLLRLAGDNVSEFLQGLITNDIKCFKEGAVSIYSVFLNNKGRVLYDTIIYKTEEKEVFYVECDICAVDNLLKHLKIYKLRRKVDIESMENSMKIWSIFNPNIVSEDGHMNIKKNNIDGKIFPCGSNNNMSIKLIDNISIYSDPRIHELGFRILTKSDITSSEVIKHFKHNVDVQDICSYRTFRYKLGVGEGTEDLSSGVSFPLEMNCDYLHGVSFHKGCYIGQELTARIHHTGVVRKRLMPLILCKVSEKSLEFDEKIINENGKVVGKFRGHEGRFGLGLIRINEALSSTRLTVKDCILKVLKPDWWPQEFQLLEATLKTSKS